MTYTNTLKALLSLALSMALLPAQTGVTGPVLGLVYDPGAGGVRLLQGIPGSVLLGERLPADLDFAVPAAQNDYAIGMESESGAIVLISGAGRQALAGAPAAATKIAISPRGSAAAIYFERTASVQIFAGLPAAPRVVRELQVDGKPSAIAVSDDAEFLIAALQRDTEDPLLLLYVAETPQILLPGARVAALDFFPGSRDALIADANSVWLMREGILTRLADERDSIADVVGVAASSDGARIVVAMRAGQVMLRDLSAGSQSVIVCNCEPTGLNRLRGNAVFRLNDPGSGPVWLLDADSPEARIVFVAVAAGGDP